MKEEEIKMKREMLEVQNEIDQADLEAEIYEQNAEEDEIEGNKYMHNITQSNPSAESWPPAHRTRVDWKKREEPNIDKLHLKEERNITPSIPVTRDKLVLPIPDIENCIRIPLTHLGNDRSDLKNLATTIQQGFVLPKPELPKFDGNPLQYWIFMRAFENNIERNTSDEN